MEIKSVSPNLASGLATLGEGRLRFSRSRELETRLSSDLAWREFFRIVEMNVRKLAYDLNLDWEFEASIQTDVETPWWERIVLRVKPMDGDFKKSIDLWDQIDTEVRRAIESAKQRIEPSLSKKISELNKNFFIEMDLG